MTDVREAVFTVLGPQNCKRVVNQDQVKLPDGEAEWELINSRMTRAQRRRGNQQVQKGGGVQLAQLVRAWGM